MLTGRAHARMPSLFGRCGIHAESDMSTLHGTSLGGWSNAEVCQNVERHQEEQAVLTTSDSIAFQEATAGKTSIIPRNDTSSLHPSLF